MARSLASLDSMGVSSASEVCALHALRTDDSSQLGARSCRGVPAAAAVAAAVAARPAAATTGTAAAGPETEAGAVAGALVEAWTCLLSDAFALALALASVGGIPS